MLKPRQYTTSEGKGAVGSEGGDGAKKVGKHLLRGTVSHYHSDAQLCHPSDGRRINSLLWCVYIRGFERRRISIACVTLRSMRAGFEPFLAGF